MEVTVGKALEGFFDSYRKGHSIRTVNQYGSELGILLALNGITDTSPIGSLGGITPDYVQRYMEFGCVSPITGGTRLVSARKFYRWCKSSRLLNYDPTRGIHCPANEEKTPTFVTKVEFLAMMKYLRDANTRRNEFKNARERAMLSTVYCEGLGEDELTDLRWGCSINEGGGQKLRIQRDCIVFDVEISRLTSIEMGRYIEAYKRKFGKEFYENPASPCFANKDGGRLSGKRIRDDFSETGENALGRSGINPRAVRNGHIVLMLQAGFTPQEISARTGSQLGTIDRLMRAAKLNQTQ